MPWVSGLLFIFGILKLPSGGAELDFTSVVTIMLFVLQAISPSLAAFVVTAATEGKLGVKALWKRFWNRSLSIKWLLVALLFISIARLIANVVIRALDDQNYPFIIPGLTFSLFISIFITTSMVDEFGWRGYVLPRFQAR